MNELVFPYKLERHFFSLWRKLNVSVTVRYSNVFAQNPQIRDTTDFPYK